MKLCAVIVAFLIGCFALTPKAGPPISIADTSWPNLNSLPCRNDLKYWWVASDLPDGPVTNWTDRIAGVVFTQPTAALRPYKSGSCVGFYGANYMTNVAVTVGGDANSDSVVIIYKPYGYSGFQALWNDHFSGAFGFAFNAISTGDFSWFSAAESGDRLITNGMNSVELFDIVLRKVNVSAPYVRWGINTNGVTVATNGAAVLTMRGLGAGAGANNFLLGELYEIQVYDSDCTMSMTDVATVHQYRLDTYGSGSVGCAGGDGYTGNTAVFDGTNDYMRRSSALTGLADGKQFTFSTWIKFDAAGNGVQQLIWNATGGGGGTDNRFTIYKDTSNFINAYGKSAAGADSLVIRGNTAVTGATGWIHLYICVDMADTAKRKIYIDEVAETLTVTTYSNVALDMGTSIYEVGAYGNNTLKLNGALTEFWFDDVYLDDTTQFVTGGQPANLDFNGQAPTGSPPPVYLRGDGNGFNVNSGIGGNFTITGSLGTTTPP